MKLFRKHKAVDDLVAPAAGPGGDAAPERVPGTFDCSQVETRDAAVRLQAAGELETMLLVPSEFGGHDVEFNTVFVPRGIPSIRDDTVTRLARRLLAEGNIDRWEAEPLYRGESIVPAAVRFHLIHSERGEQAAPLLPIW